MSGIVYSRSVRVAGSHMDEAIMNYLKERHKLQIGERTAERIKIEIGSASPLDKPLIMDVRGRDLIEGVPKTITIHGREIREAMMECVITIMNAIRVVLGAHTSGTERRHRRSRHRAHGWGRAAEELGQAHPR